MREAAKQSVPYMRRLWDEQVARSKAIIENSGVAVNEVDPAPFAELMTGMWDQSLDSSRQRELVARIQSLRGGGQ